MKSRLRSILGPGLVTGASDDDPSGIATYSQAGAQFGFAISWTMLFSYPLMAAVQEISARIGRTTGRGLAGNIRLCYPAWLLDISVALIFVANTINIGADLGAMGEASRMLFGGPFLIYVPLMGILCTLLQIFVSYKRTVSVLRWLTLSLLAYFGAALLVNVSWAEVARGLLVPTFFPTVAFATVVVAILGTTISPYLFFWQASQEVEDVKTSPVREPLTHAQHQAGSALRRIRLDTFVGMAVSNLVAIAIIITTGATLHAHGITEIESAAQAAEALRPIAGQFAFALFAVGIIGTGLLAIPVLAGSAAYAIGEARKWPTGLSQHPLRAKAFYATLTMATTIGIVANFAQLDPIKALFWSAVLNGIVAVPIMVLMMCVAANSRVMGGFVVSGVLRFVGWLATLVMALAVIAMLVTAGLSWNASAS
jgi:NRAMP (natural resistance-associated macrophage protein)-like metal ion transporter